MMHCVWVAVICLSIGAVFGAVLMAAAAASDDR
jgi:hypothetical protein